MNENLIIGITRKKIVEILESSNLSVTVLALLMDNLTKDIQQLADNAFYQAYQKAQTDGQVEDESIIEIKKDTSSIVDK